VPAEKTGMYDLQRLYYPKYCVTEKPATDSRMKKRKSLDRKLACIRDAIDEARRRCDGDIEILICFDFNRHHILWGGGGTVVRQRKTEGVPIVYLAQEYGLLTCCLLGRLRGNMSGKSNSPPLTWSWQA